MSTPAVTRSRLSQSTLDSLMTAMKGEAFAYVKYMLFAEHARNNGRPDIAAAFERAAKTERFEHFAEEAQLAGLVGTDGENLLDALAGESYEIETMYKEFAQLAFEAGDREAAERFEEVRQDEIEHRDLFRAALEKLPRAG
ncbi:MAG TPA: rubrerythrin family protein [Candidatus Acidoferrales bacterium]|nr:rubrerythrin family protein [Candidatus Acidoferrales bacterium]